MDRLIQQGRSYDVFIINNNQLFAYIATCEDPYQSCQTLLQSLCYILDVCNLLFFYVWYHSLHKLRVQVVVIKHHKTFHLEALLDDHHQVVDALKFVEVIL